MNVGISQTVTYDQHLNAMTQQNILDSKILRFYTMCCSQNAGNSEPKMQIQEN